MDTDIVKVLVVDDELAVGLFLKSILERVPGVEVAEVITDSLEAVQQVDHHKAQVVFPGYRYAWVEWPGFSL